MPFNGSGTFTRLFNFAQDKVNNVKIQAARTDAEFDGIAAGLTNCITKDGQTQLTGPFNVNNQRLVGVATATLGTDGLNRDTGDGRYLLASGETRNWSTSAAVTAASLTATGAASVGTGLTVGGGLNITGGGATITGQLTQKGDMYVYRPGSPGTGAIYYGSAGTAYIYWDGGNWTLNPGQVYTAGGRLATETFATNQAVAYSNNRVAYLRTIDQNIYGSGGNNAESAGYFVTACWWNGGDVVMLRRKLQYVLGTGGVGDISIQ